uniref:Uncharacterized protein n=1 Tax=mine drainage metagenome TaxID=410659 RepID=E6QP39_9ZZZZ
MFCVAAADVEEVPVEELGGLGDGLGNELVPLFFAVFVEAALAEKVFVGESFTPGVVGELEAGAEMSVGEERRAESGAEGETEFDALAVDGSVALNGGVVGQADRLFPAFLQGFFKREICPCRVEVEGGQGGSVLDDSGKADRDAIKGGHLFFQCFENGENAVGGGGVGS